MRLLKRIAFYSSGAISVLAAVLFVALGWLAFTEAGARWALMRALPLAPVSVQFYELQGTLWRGLRVRQLSVAADDHSLGFERAEVGELSFRWQPLALMSGRLVFDRVHLRDLQLQLAENTAAPEAEPALPQFFVPLAIDVRHLSTRNLNIQQAGQSHSLPDARLRVMVQGDQLLVSRLQLEYEGVPYALSLRAHFGSTFKLVADISSHGIQASGSCYQAAPWACEARVNWAGFSHPLTGEFASPKGELALNLQGELLTIEGAADFAWAFAPAPIDTQLLLAGQLNLKSQNLEVTRFNGEFSGGQVQATGALQFAQGFAMQIQVGAQKLSLAQWLPEALAESQAQLRSTLDLKVHNDEVDLRWAISELQLDLGARPITGSTEFYVNGQGLGFDKVALSGTSGSLTGSAYFGFDERVRLDARLQADALERLVPELSGQLDLTAKASGTAKAPVFSLQAQGTELAIAGWRARDLSLATQLQTQATDAPGWSDQLRALEIATFDARVQGLHDGTRELGELALQLSGTAARHQINMTGQWLPDHIRLEALSVNGRVELPAKATNTGELLSGLRWQPLLAKLEVSDLWLREPWRLVNPSRGDVSASALQWQALCLARGQAEVCWDELRMENWKSLSAHGRVAGIYLDRERSLFSEFYDTVPLGWQLRGEAVADWQVTLGELASARPQVALDVALALKGAGMRYQEDGETTLDLPVQSLRVRATGNQGLLDITGAARLAEDEPINLSGQLADWLTENRALTGRIAGQLHQLTYLQPFMPSVQALSGRAEMDLSLELLPGREEPVYDGRLLIADVGMLVPASGTNLKDWRLLMEAVKGDLQVSGGGLVGEGRATVNGMIRADRASAKGAFTARLAIEGEGLTLTDLPDARLQASPDLVLTGNGQRWHLAGDVQVDDSLVVLRDLPEAASDVSQDAKVYGLQEPQAPRNLVVFTSDVALRLGDDVRFEGFGLTTRVDGNLRFTRDEHRLDQLHGVLGLPEGRFRSYGQKLDIKNGRIIFSGAPDNPALDVRAARKINDVEAGIWLTGTAKYPKTELYSTPPMSEADILAYMVSGKPISESGQGEVSDMQSAALGLGLKQALPLLQRIGGQFGFSDVSIEESSSGGSSIAAGRRLSDRLYIKYVYGLVGAAGNFVVQYQLSDQVTLETSSGDTQAIDITYKWSSTPPTPAESSAQLREED
ncbi:translocation/assembly module TamB domain-containing protein [Simiduia sp. 21SJ11W-1]|uniref:translocation/assembly module TamB domain-containing protein n=1 Tax=Simiduia sp. 21SJ11W-1 TaxID=2909669 RepID=UPI00209D7B17|nr:translocation/assembly module TamB domain-containing protein [Simiduia sp. 21SJ11W-1]UTA48471.1 translocation/assembly module TamB domain-containing protein [Simiduia sp. 21SJ11W-1]